MAYAALALRGLLRLAPLAALALSFPAHAASSDEYRELAAVNRRVNDLPLTNCKSYAFEKLARLEAEGIPARFVVVRTETGAYHAIVVVGEWALDSRYKFLMTVDQLRRDGYQIAALRPQ